MLKILKNRYTQIGILVFFLFIALGAQLAYLQIRNGQVYAKEADQRRVRTISESAPRGMILDRYGRILAGNRQGYKVQMLIQDVPKGQLNTVILNTIKLIEKSGDHYEDNLLIQYWPSSRSYDWSSRDLSSWKDENQLPAEATAPEILAVMRKRFGISPSLSTEKAFQLTAFRTQINMGDPDIKSSISLTDPLDSSYLAALKKLVSQYPQLLKIEESSDEKVKQYTLYLIPTPDDNTLYNEIGTKLFAAVPSINITAIHKFPIALVNGSQVDWSTRELRAWKKALNIKDDMDAASAFEYLKKKYDISDGLSPQDIRKTMSIRIAITQLGYRAYYPVLIANDVNTKTVATIEENNMDLPGIVVQNEYIRNYPNGTLFAQSLGYIGKITADKAQEYKEKGYDLSSDLIGRAGLESSMEPYLKGQSGSEQVEVNKMGRVIRVLNEKPAVPGGNVTLTIDAKVQKAAEDALADTIHKIQKGDFGKSYPNAKVGGAVAIDIKTGEVLALASYPTYDPNLFANGTIDPKIWKELNPRYPHPKYPNQEDHDPTLPRPMLNNAITAAFPPGSTFKMVVGAAGLKEGVVGVHEEIIDKGPYTKYTTKNAPACWIWNEYGTTHGPEDIIGAIRDSCNYYFFTVGDRLGIKKIEEYARFFGLGVKTGIEIPGESAGTIAGDEFTNRFLTSIVQSKIKSAMKEKYNRDLTLDDVQQASLMANDMINHFSITTVRNNLKTLGYKKNDQFVWDIYSYINENRWTPGRTLSASIGQGDNNYTVLQMANYIAGLINGKEQYKPHVVLNAKDAKGTTVLEKKPEVASNIALSPEIHNAILQGMGAVTSNVYQGQDGTASKFFRDFPIRVGGKTGTAQFTKGKDNYAWFVAFAPFDDPQIAVAVAIGQGGSGSYASPVAKAIFAEYLGLNQPKDLPHPNSLQP